MTPRKVNPPHYFGLSLVAMACLRYLVGGEPLLGNASWFGIVPILAGISVAILAARQFERAGTNIVPLTPSSALVTDGMFAWSRNPMYSSMTTVLVGPGPAEGGADAHIARITDLLTALPGLSEPIDG